ncbi:MAG TPA: hypothetical protein PLR12_02855 [Clostridia bacterium]|nr:hypothetical protein [Clostridia bacterium]
MRIHKTALNTIIISTLVALLALALGLFGQGMKFSLGAEAAMAWAPLLLSVLAALAVSFLFGWVRYGLDGGLSLAIAVLHDQLLSLAMCSIYSLAFGLSAYTVPLLVAGLAFTYLFTVPLLRDARARMHGNSSLTRAQAAEMAVKSTRPLKLLVVLLSALVLLAFAVGGNVHMYGSLLPLLSGLIAAALSSCLITPHVWAAFAIRASRRK